MYEIWSVYRGSGRLNSRLAWDLDELEAQIMVDNLVGGQDYLVILTEEEAVARFEREQHDFFHWRQPDWRCQYCKGSD